jgi:flagellar biosynthesis protein FlhA
MAAHRGVRRKLTQDVGFLIPSVHIRDNLELPPNGYRVLVHGVPVATAEIHPDRELAMDPGSALGAGRHPGKDPAFGLDATWIQPHQRAQAETLGYTVVDPATVVATHLSHLIREHAPELLGHEEVQQLLATLAKSAPKLVEDLTPKALPLSAVARAAEPAGRAHSDPPAAQDRRGAGRTRAQQPGPGRADRRGAHRAGPLHRAGDRRHVAGAAGVHPQPATGTCLAGVHAGQRRRAGTRTRRAPAPELAECVSKQEARNEPAVVLVPGPVRAALARLVRHSVPRCRCWPTARCRTSA